MSVRIGWLVDGAIGGMSRLLHGIRGADHDTSRDVGPYLDLAPSRMFPAPERLPIVKRRRSVLPLTRTIETLSFASEHVPLCPKYRLRHDVDYAVNHTVHARWMRPDKHPRKSLLLYVHGWLEPFPQVDEATMFPRFIRDVGVDVAHIQLPFHGRRNPKRALFHGEFYWSADLVRSLEAIRQSVIDVRSAMAWFRTQGYDEIGVAGISLGGSITMLLACVAPTPDYVVPIISHLDLADAVEHAPILWRMKSDLERFGVDAEKRRELFDRIGFAKLMPVLAPERQLWVAARDDMYLTARSVERQWNAWGRPPILWIDGGHMTFPIAFNAIVRRMAEFRRTLPEGPASR